MVERATIYADCAKVLLRIYAGTKEAEIGAVTRARKDTLAIMRELLESCEDDTEVTIARHVQSALSDLHPEIPYRMGDKLTVEKLVRDLADICATFRSIELGVERSSRETFLEAKIFCDHMADELSQPPH